MLDEETDANVLSGQIEELAMAWERLHLWAVPADDVHDNFITYGTLEILGYPYRFTLGAAIVLSSQNVVVKERRGR